MILGNLGVETDHPPEMCTGLLQVMRAEFDKNMSVVNSTAAANCSYLISKAEASAGFPLAFC